MRHYTRHSILCGLLVILFVQLSLDSIGQELCPIWTAEEPLESQTSSFHYAVEDKALFRGQDWEIHQSVNLVDSVKVSLGRYDVANEIRFSNLMLNVPPASTIHGIKVKCQGYTEGNGAVKEVMVSLQTKTKFSANYEGKGYNSKNVWKKHQESTWYYGRDDENWGVNWSTQDLNSEDFTVAMRLKNIRKDSIDIFITNVQVEVFYTPVPTFCPNTCPTFYVDPIDADYYSWHVPSGFKVISTDNRHIVDLHAKENTPNGVYQICVDAIKNDEEVASCCRQFRFVSCTPGSIGDFVWNDLNRNGLQDSNEPGIGSVAISLFGVSGQLMDTQISSSNGKYEFENVESGYYYIRAAQLGDYSFTDMINGSNDLNSDVNQLGQSSIFFVDYGELKENVDIGLVQLGSISGVVWEDDNADGLRSSNEMGLANKKVDLLDATGTLVQSIFTENDGTYQFQGISTGDYKIQLPNLNSDYQVSPKNVGQMDVDSDFDSMFETEVISITTAGVDNIDAGVYRSASLGDLVWIDANCNGNADDSELGRSDILLYLWNDMGVKVDSTSTTSDGGYLWNNLTPGKYVVEVVSDGSFVATEKAQSILNMIGNRLMSDTITLTSGLIYLEADLGTIRTTSDICGKVWFDSNYDGINDDDESPLSMIKVELRSESGVLIRETSTDADGHYCFDEVLPSNYIIAFETVDSMIFSPANVGVDSLSSSVVDAEGNTALITAESGKVIQHINAGYANKVSIGDYVWNDKNANGLQDDDEPGIAGVDIVLYDSSGNLMQAVTSNSFGYYEIKNITPGTYFLEIKIDNRYKVVLKQGMDNSVDSDVTNDFGPNTTSLYTFQANETYDNIDFGLEDNVGSICGRLWFDEIADGLRHPSETDGIEGVSIEAVNENGFGMGMAVTDELGFYCIDDLLLGDYRIRIIDLPVTQQVGPKDFGTNDDVDSDFDEIGVTDLVSLDQNGVLDHIDGGISNKSIVGNYTWLDANQNGLQDMDEMGLPAVNVALYSASDELIEEVTSDANGFYQFVNVGYGTYYVEFSTLATYDFTMITNDMDLGSDATPNGKTELFTVIGNEDRMDIDAGYVGVTGGISGSAWEDTNENGRQDNGEPFLSNIKVTLYDESSMELMTTETNFMGTYSFANLQVGNYIIGFEVKDKQPFTSEFVGGSQGDSDVSSSSFYGSTEVIALGPNEFIEYIDAGYLPLMGSIKGMAWMDQMGEGIFDQGEMMFSDLAVELYSIDSVLIDVVATDSLGQYEFEQVMNGMYFVKFNFDSTCFKSVMPYEGLDTLIDSDLTNILGDFSSSQLEISGPTNWCGINGGVVGYGSIEGMSFIDGNENGIRDDNESGFDKIGICLLNAEGEVVGKDTTKTSNGMTGLYDFGKLVPGKYVVQFTRPLNYAISDKDVGSNDTIDSDVFLIDAFNAVTDTIELKSKDTISTIDFGLFFKQELKSSISGVVWEELEVDGIRTMADTLKDDVTIFLFNDSDQLIKTENTDANGVFHFDLLPEGFYYLEANLGQDQTSTHYLVGMDRTVDNDFLVEDGAIRTSTFYLGVLQDTSHLDLGITQAVNIGDKVWEDENFNGIIDPSEPGVEGVEMTLYNNVGDELARDTTDENGRYRFRRFPIGTYQVGITLPTGFALTKLNNGMPNEDSDFHDDGKTEAFTLVSGGNMDSIDAGIVAFGSIGDKMFIDFNGNGMQNTGEPGMSGFKVELYTAEGDFVTMDTTKGDMTMGLGGFYKFEDIKPGDYYVVFYTQDDYHFTSANNAADDIDSDVTSSIVEGSTDVFTLLPGEFKNTVDAGIYYPSTIGDFVWLDVNKDGIQDADEVGIEGVQVELLNAGGQVLKTAQSDENGYYAFESLKQGLYSVRFEMLMDYSITARDNAPDDMTDSDADPNTGRTSLVSLAHGATFLGVDCGYYEDSGLQEMTEDRAIFSAEKLSPRPNPAVFETTFSVEDGIYELYITNMLGQIIKTDRVEAINGLIRYDVSDLDAGKSQFVLKNERRSYSGTLIRVY